MMDGPISQKLPRSSYFNWHCETLGGGDIVGVLWIGKSVQSDQRSVQEQRQSASISILPVRQSIPAQQLLE